MIYLVALKNIVHCGHLPKTGEVFPVGDIWDKEGKAVPNTAQGEAERLIALGFARMASGAEQAAFLAAGREGRFHRKA